MYPSMDKNLRKMIEENQDIPQTMEETVEKTKEMRQRIDEMHALILPKWFVYLNE